MKKRTWNASRTGIQTNTNSTSTVERFGPVQNTVPSVRRVQNEILNGKTLWKECVHEECNCKTLKRSFSVLVVQEKIKYETILSQICNTYILQVSRVNCCDGVFVMEKNFVGPLHHRSLHTLGLQKGVHPKHFQPETSK